MTSLDDQTAYSFRLCGIDQSTRGRPVCAQTRSFITGSASVQVFGSTQPAPPGEDSNADIDVNVASGAPGGSPLGGSSLGGITAGPVARSAESCSKSGSRTTDNITCLNVEGSVAVVGYRQIPPNPDDVRSRTCYTRWWSTADRQAQGAIACLPVRRSRTRTATTARSRPT